MAVDRTVRAADRDRSEAITALGEHLGAGRLTVSEFDDRVAALTQSLTLADIDRVFADLPPLQATRPQPAETARTAHIPRTAALARRHAHPDSRWPVWASVGLVCLAIWAVTSLTRGTPAYFWPGWVIGPWGAVLLMRAGGLPVCGSRRR